MKLKYIKDPESNLIADLQSKWTLYDTGDKIVLKNYEGVSIFRYSSLEEFAKEWETIKEPLLKGDLRLALKIWTEQCNAKSNEQVTYYVFEDYSEFKLFTEDKEGIVRCYNFEIPYHLPKLEDVKSYTVEQLVGEE